MENGFKMKHIDTTLFIKTNNKDMLIIQIYVDDIIFVTTNISLCEEFGKFMHSEFEISMMGELILPSTSNQTTKGKHLHQPSQVH